MDEILIIGAGASGLMAASILSAGGKKVQVLEAKEKVGGRIHTIHPADFSMRIEGGAEFIHGNLPLTLKLLREAGLSYAPVRGKLWHASGNSIHQLHDYMEGSELLVKKLKELEKDISISEFLQSYFGGEQYKELRASIKGFVEGYDLADLDNASTFGLRDEWTKEKEHDQYRVDKGYGALMSYLQQKCEQNGCQFYFNRIGSEIHWKENQVSLATISAETFSANKILITVPLGVWQCKVSERPFIKFHPAIEEKVKAARSIGFGEVIKIILEFEEPFWELPNIVGKRRMKDLVFLFSDAEIPTWWTQLPAKNAVLTGWFGGPGVRKYVHQNNESILQLAMNSLSNIFNIEHAVLIEKLKAWQIFNWSADEFTGGGYAYQSLEMEKHKKKLGSSLGNTLFFAGEALAEGSEIGTVEAALSSGAKTAREMMGK